MAAEIIRTIEYTIAGGLLSLCPGHTGLTLSTTSDKGIKPLVGKVSRDSVLKKNWVLPIPFISRCHNQCIAMGVDIPKMSPIQFLSNFLIGLATSNKYSGSL